MAKKDTLRPMQHLHAAAHFYPKAWPQVNAFLERRGRDLPAWHRSCFLPMAAWYAIVSEDAGGQTPLPLHLVEDVSRLAAIGTWHYSKGIYRFDDTLASAISKSSLKGEIPVNVFLQLPEWCTYIETPDLRWADAPLYGFFAHIEHDQNNGRLELRLLLDSELALTGIPIHLGEWSVTEAVDRFMSVGRSIGSLPPTMGTEYVPQIADSIQPLLVRLLYLCSDNPDIISDSRPDVLPKHTQGKTTKKGFRWFSPPKPQIWQVGQAMGAQLRRSQAEPSPAGSITPHIRDGHWHGYWTGAHSDARRFSYEWLAPMLVNTKK